MLFIVVRFYHVIWFALILFICSHFNYIACFNHFKFTTFLILVYHVLISTNVAFIFLYRLYSTHYLFDVKSFISLLVLLTLLLGANYLTKTLNQPVTDTMHIHVSNVLCRWWKAVENKYINNLKEIDGIKPSIQQI